MEIIKRKRGRPRKYETQEFITFTKGDFILYFD